MKRIDLGTPTLLKLEGPDTARFLNGQLTQDVKLVSGSNRALPACVTDHKGKLQFRVWLHARGEAILVEAPEGQNENLEARLTRYLIADEVEVEDLSSRWQLHHLTDFDGKEGGFPELDDAIVKESKRFGTEGLDLWLPAAEEIKALADIPLLEGDELEALRIKRGVPAWGRELTEGLLPPEAGLEATDISYAKGCYIGQEVISRIKSAGKVPRRLVRLRFDASIPTEGLELVDGELTSISPIAKVDQRLALGYLKRGAETLLLRDGLGSEHPAQLDPI